MTNIEQEKQNVKGALEQAREDWLTATGPIEAENQLKALDALLDTANKMGMFAVQASQ